jgi:hypothetical protein
MKCGTWSDFSEESYFRCYKCQEDQTVFRTRWYTGYHASGNEDQIQYVCAKCYTTLDIMDASEGDIKDS